MYIDVCVCVYVIFLCFGSHSYQHRCQYVRSALRQRRPETIIMGNAAPRRSSADAACVARHYTIHAHRLNSHCLSTGARPGPVMIVRQNAPVAKLIVNHKIIWWNVTLALNAIIPHASIRDWIRGVRRHGDVDIVKRHIRQRMRGKSSRDQIPLMFNRPMSRQRQLALGKNSPKYEKIESEFLINFLFFILAFFFVFNFFLFNISWIWI